MPSVKVATCEYCGAEFMSVKNRGRWAKFCSKSCRFPNAVKIKSKICKHCQEVFTPGRSNWTSDGLHDYCSFACARAGTRKRTEVECDVCGNKFYQKYAKNRFCSAKCQHVWYQSCSNPNWRGGEHVEQQGGSVITYHPRKWKKTKYVGLHRVVAGAIVGRDLLRSEPVLHINGDKLDNSPENLFVCMSIAEMRHRYNGTMPWPESSNLMDILATAWCYLETG